MNMPEFQNGKLAYVDNNVVNMFKNAITYIQEPAVRWESSDGESEYNAFPLSVDGGEDTDILEQLYDLPEMPVFWWQKVLNSWVVERVGTNCGGEKPLRVDRLIVESGKFLVSASIEFDPLDPDFNHEPLQDDLASQLRDNNPTMHIEDYALLHNAAHDLRPVWKAAYTNFYAVKLNMTDQEKRLERMAKFNWLVMPEIDKTKGPGWWTISEMSLLYTVRASSPDEAAAMLDEHHEKNGGDGILPLFFINRCSDDVSAVFDETLVHSDVVRLIPYSNVPFQEAGAELTPEQKAAWQFIKDLERHKT